MAARIDIQGPTRTSDDPVIDKVNMLIRLATDPASRNTHEGENAGRRLAALIDSNGLVITNAATNASTGRGAPTSQSGLESAELAHLRDRLAFLQRQFNTVASELEGYRFREKQQREWLEQYQANRAARAIEALTPELLALFDTGDQPGADRIAKKLGRNAADVRAAVAKLLAEGVLVANGKTRNRTYSRPTHTGRDSFTSDVDGTENGSGNSSPPQRGRESFTSAGDETEKQEPDSRPSGNGRKRAA